MSYALAGGGHGGGGGHHGGGGGGHHGGGGGHHGGGRGFGPAGFIGPGGGYWGGADWGGPGLIVVEPDTNPCARPDLYPTPLAAIQACAAYQAATQLRGMGDAASLYTDFKAGSWKWALGGAVAAYVLSKFL